MGMWMMMVVMNKWEDGKVCGCGMIWYLSLHENLKFLKSWILRT